MTFKTISIGTNHNGPLLANLHVPSGEGAWPLVVGVSGGGWVQGHRSSLSAWGDWFANHGIAFASVDYRRAQGEAVFPGNAEDVAAALCHFATNGDKLGIAADRIAVVGVSAGAHLSALAILSDQFALPPVRAFVGVYGVYDLMAHWQADVWRNAAPGHNKTEAMLGCTPFDDPLLFHRASPLRQITYDKALPALLIWGQADREVMPDAQSAAFARALVQARFPVRTLELPDAGHLWFSEEGPESGGSHSARVAPDLLRFVQRQLAPAAEQASRTSQ